ncbi:preprotein translocase, SecG subunit [Atopobium sp. oral taxon 810 str. F0209]|nr:preprotein translocase, SecG subunit [Atopobium sp. oral taxon 810 str. F0209]
MLSVLELVCGCVYRVKESFVNVLNIILVVLLIASGLFTGLLILMHSGKGTGVSDMIASSMYNSAAGSAVWEKNLDRLTVISAVVFGLCIVIMALTFPLGTI